MTMYKPVSPLIFHISS